MQFCTSEEARITRCYKCSLKSHIRVNCTPLTLKAKERQTRVEVVGDPLLEDVEEQESEASPKTRTITRIKEMEMDKEWETVMRSLHGQLHEVNKLAGSGSTLSDVSGYFTWELNEACRTHTHI